MCVCSERYANAVKRIELYQKKQHSIERNLGGKFHKGNQSIKSWFGKKQLREKRLKRIWG